jgi:L-asparagine oxygenase
MTVVTETSAGSAPVTLATADAEAVEELARALSAVDNDLVDATEWVDDARRAWDEAPVGLRRPLREFRRDSGPRGAMLLRNLPVDEHGLPATPTVNGSVQRTVAVPAAVLMMIATGLGDPAAFLPEKTGALVQDVVPVPGKEEFQGNAGSVLLEWHTENAFHPNRPDYVMLLCLRQDHEGVAGLRTSCARTVLPMLTDQAREALFSREFVTQAPPSFGLGSDGAVEHAVLFGAEEDPNLQVDLAATTAQTPRAAAALEELRDRFNDASQTLRLRPGDLAIVDNRVTVHGRTGFAPRYDGKDRWLQRTFVMNDLRRSRFQRPGDGYVLV